jgi:hypothetical protein
LVGPGLEVRMSVMRKFVGLIKSKVTKQNAFDFETITGNKKTRGE